MRSVRRLHRGCAAVVTLFVLVHLANHAAALDGVAPHLRFMEGARLVYRQPLVESILLLCVAVQAATGLWLLRSGWRRRTGRIAALQSASGAYLALFLLIHVAAVLAGRALLDLDTNVHFAAAGLQAWPWKLFFIPYYFLAVLAVFAHPACALARRMRTAPHVRTAALAVPLGAGVVLSGLVLAALTGQLYPYQVPQAYQNTYRAQVAPPTLPLR